MYFTSNIFLNVTAVQFLGLLQCSSRLHLQYKQQDISFTRQGHMFSLAHLMQLQGIGKSPGRFDSVVTMGINLPFSSST